MLELRPTCEHCNTALPASATNAMICSFECTFCTDCVEHVLANVCPNCGGGFAPRPIRPGRPHVRENSLQKYPAGTRVVHKPVDPAVQARLIEQLAGVPPNER